MWICDGNNLQGYKVQMYTLVMVTKANRQTLIKGNISKNVCDDTVYTQCTTCICGDMVTRDDTCKYESVCMSSYMYVIS